MTFEYLQRVLVDSELSVDNIGECVIQARNDLGEEWYLLITSEMGWTEVIEYGPAHPDLNLLPPNITQTYSRFEYNDGKLCRIIDSFLNNPKRGVTQAEVVEVQDIRHFMVNPLDRVFGKCEEEE